MLITDIDSNGDLTYDITCFFETDVSDLESILEVSDVLVSDSFSIIWSVMLLFTVADFDTYKVCIDDFVKDLKDAYALDYDDDENITYSVSELEYGWDLTFDDSALNQS